MNLIWFNLSINALPNKENKLCLQLMDRLCSIDFITYNFYFIPMVWLLVVGGINWADTNEQSHWSIIVLSLPTKWKHNTWSTSYMYTTCACKLSSTLNLHLTLSSIRKTCSVTECLIQVFIVVFHSDLWTCTNVIWNLDRFHNFCFFITSFYYEWF